MHSTAQGSFQNLWLHRIHHGFLDYAMLKGESFVDSSTTTLVDMTMESSYTRPLYRPNLKLHE